jgi:hypothetical protein
MRCSEGGLQSLPLHAILNEEYVPSSSFYLHSKRQKIVSFQFTRRLTIKLSSAVDWIEPHLVKLSVKLSLLACSETHTHSTTTVPNESKIKGKM